MEENSRGWSHSDKGKEEDGIRSQGRRESKFTLGELSVSCSVKGWSLKQKQGNREGFETIKNYEYRGELL